MTIHYTKVESGGRVMGLRGAFLTKYVDDISEKLMDIFNLQEATDDTSQRRYVVDKEDRVVLGSRGIGFVDYEIHIPKTPELLAVGMYIEKEPSDTDYQLEIMLEMSYGLVLGCKGIDPIYSKREQIPPELLRNTP